MAWKPKKSKFVEGVKKTTDEWNNKKDIKAAKLEKKVAKYTRKAERAAPKAANLHAGTAGRTLKSLKYEAKAKKWANAMNEAFANTKVSNIDPSDIRVGEAYFVTFINEYMKKDS